MARPKGSKNKPKYNKGATSGAGSSGGKRVITVEITEDVIMRNFTASELLQIAGKLIARGSAPSTTVQAPAAPRQAAPSTDGRRTRRRRRFSAEARAKMAEAQRQRWAKYRKEK